MNRAVTARGRMAILATGSHARDALPTSCARTARENLGCELAAEVLRTWGKLRLRVTGASMLPAVWPGDILSIQRHDAVEALPGDIVLFGREGRLVAHRVVERTICQDRIQWVTRGDRAGRNDAPVSSHELLGRVTAIQRGSCRIVPRVTIWGRTASWVLRRSEFCTRMVLRVRDMLIGNPTNWCWAGPEGQGFSPAVDPLQRRSWTGQGVAPV